jgi:hypothetical protein
MPGYHGFRECTFQPVEKKSVDQFDVTFQKNDHGEYGAVTEKGTYCIRRSSGEVPFLVLTFEPDVMYQTPGALEMVIIWDTDDVPPLFREAANAHWAVINALDEV